MLPPHFLLKLILTPLIIVGSTLVARRWGERVGGMIIGLPLTSGPVSIFFALEQGRTFAAGAARGAILGLVAVAVFCAAYGLSARRWAWHTSALISSLLYLAAVWGVSFVTPPFWLEVVLVAGVLAAALFITGRAEPPGPAFVSPWWDLPMRILLATALLVLITTLAGALGPRWGGLLSPFPIFTFVMATFSHSQGSPQAARRIIRGVLTGLFSYTAFFIAVNLLVESASLGLVYTLAAAAALGTESVSLTLVAVRSRLRHAATARAAHPG